MFRNMNDDPYNDGGQYDDAPYGNYDQNQFNGYSAPMQQISGSNQQSSNAGGRLLRKGIVSIARSEPAKPEPQAEPQPQPQLENQSSEIPVKISIRPKITKPKVNGPTQIPSQEIEIPPQNLTKNASQPQISNQQFEYNQQPYEDDYNDYYQQQQQMQQQQQFYEEDYNDYYPKQEPVEQIQQLPKPKKQQNYQSQKQSSYNYNYDTPNTIANERESLSNLFRQRQPLIESNFSTSLERSMKNFKRSFANEFQVIMRQVQSDGPLSSRSIFDINEYCEGLKSDINTAISGETNNVNNARELFETKSSTISRKVGAAIDEYTKPFSVTLAEAASRNSLAADHHISELRQLQDELDCLTNLFKTTSDSIVKELQRESQNSAVIRDKEQMRYRSLEQKMRTMRMKRTELESRANKLSSDRQNVESEMKDFEQKKRQWEQDELPFFYDEKGVMRQKIMVKLSEIKSAVEKEASFAGVIEAVDDGINAVKEESENIKNELLELELMNRNIMQRINESFILKNLQNSHNLRQPMTQSQMTSNIPNTSFNAFNGNSSHLSPRRSSTLLIEAREKLELARKEREETMKLISSNFL